MQSKDARFIETLKVPISTMNDKSGGEKQGGGRPPFWEMVFWWTRKPLIGARAVIAASLLPEEIDVNEFMRITKLLEKTPHRYSPNLDQWKKYFEGKKLLDPFAGFGSIPLEGLRLGLQVTASELLPTAYIFLKAVLDYPVRYGDKLAEDVKKWGDWITENLRKDSDIKELYEGDVAVYIGTWEVKCPHCARWTPLVGNWWLARVKNKEGYKRLAYMDYERGKDGIKIKVVDVNRDIRKKWQEKENALMKGAKVSSGRGEIVAGGKTYKVPSSNLNSRRQQATCLNCGSLIRFVDEEGSHYTEKKEVAKDERNELEWYVKWALKKYHQGDEGYARQRLLVKVKTVDKDLVFEPCNEKDNEKLDKAKEKIRELEKKGDVDIPYEHLQPYGGATLGDIHKIFINWHSLFNPRQLFTLVKLAKLIREAGKKVEEEKKKQGWSEKEARGYAEGVATYLGVALVRYVDYNTIVTVWNPGGQLPAQVAHSLSMRGIAMQWNWGDVSPYIGMSGTGGWIKNLNSLHSRVVPYFTSTSFLSSSNRKIEENLDNNSKSIILLDDATTLSKVNEKYDVIVTDPPYADDVAYTELSDFYYVWLKRALSDVDNGKLVPRFHPEVFFKKIGTRYVEIKTQWQEFAKREVSEYPARFLDSGNPKKKAREHFQNLLTQSFIAMRNHLKENGLLVTYYAHTSPEAWASLLEAGWKGAKAKVTNAFPLTTESAQRVTARGKLALDTSIVVVWRIEEQKEEKNILDLKDRIINSAKNRTKGLIRQGYVGRDVLVGAMASALGIVTEHKDLYDGKGDLSVGKLLTEYVYPFTAMGIVESLREMAKVGEIKSPEILFYLLVKALFGSKEKMIDKKMDRNDINLLKISTKVNPNKLIGDCVIKKIKGEYILQEPTSSEILFLEAFLREKRGINPGKVKLRNSLDALHLLEYYSVIFGEKKFKERWQELKEKYPSELEEAFSLAKILSQILPDVDCEKSLAGEFARKIEDRPKSTQLEFGGILKWE